MSERRDMREGEDRRRHPRGGRRAKRAYAAQPYLAPRDAGFYGFCWASGLTALGGGASLDLLLAAGIFWAAWLFLAWRISAWLRAQEDFDSAAADALASPVAGAMLGWVLPVLAALIALLLTRGRLWWEPLIAAGLIGMAGNASAAFVERSFRMGALWALAALIGGLGHPAPVPLLGWIAAGLGLWHLVVTRSQAAAFRHFPDGPVPDERHLAGDFRMPMMVLGLALLAAWAWTPALKPRRVQIMPEMRIPLWLPDGGKYSAPLPFFGLPPMDAMGGAAPKPSLAAEGLGEALKAALAGSGRGIGVAAGAAVLLLGWLLWRRWKRRKAAAALVAEAKRREKLRGPGVMPRARAPSAPPPEDPRAAVVYWYNRLRGELAGLGVPKQEALTPAEYARELVGRGPIDSFTELFQEAEYSAHPLGEQAKTKAKAYYEGVAARVAETG